MARENRTVKYGKGLGPQTSTHSPFRACQISIFGGYASFCGTQLSTVAWLTVSEFADEGRRFVETQGCCQSEARKFGGCGRAHAPAYDGFSQRSRYGLGDPIRAKADLGTRCIVLSAFVRTSDTCGESMDERRWCGMHNLAAARAISMACWGRRPVEASASVRAIMRILT